MTVTPRSLRDKQLLFASVLVLAPALVVGFIAERSARDSLERVIGDQLAREAAHTADRLESVLANERDSLEGFARQDLMRDLRVGDIDKRVSRALATLRSESAARLDYAALDREGRAIAASRPDWIGALPAWMHLPPESSRPGGRFWGPLPDQTGEQRLLMSTPVPDPDADAGTIGRIVAVYDWPALTGVMEQVRGDLERREILADVVIAAEGGVILRTARSASAGEPRLEPDFRQLAATDPDAQALVSSAARIIAGRAEIRVPGGGAEPSGWTLWVVEPLAVAFAPATQLRNRIALTVVAALSAAWLITALASRRLIRPLSELTAAIKGLSRGDASILRVPVRTRDEVGELSAAFNHMASELDRVQRDLVDAEKFAFVGELASGVAHEVRTSLGVLRSSAQVLERSLQDDAEPRELVQMIRAEVDRLGGVVDDLLTLDRSRRFHPEPVPLASPLRSAIEFVEPRATERGIDIRAELEDPSAIVVCDAEMIQEMCVNLLVNAVEALPRGGTIEVQTLPARDGYAGFVVRDDGAGVPEALRDRIFRPFVTAREGGVGLGLTFVKRVVHEHQGRIQLEPGAGRGACFRVELPEASST